MFQGIFKGVLRNFQGGFMKFSRVFQEGFNGVSSKLELCSKIVSKVFLRRLKVVLREL